MNNSLKLLLEQVYELEGLLLVADNHGNETHEYVLELIHKKAASIAEMAELVNKDVLAEHTDATGKEPEIAAEPAEVAVSKEEPAATAATESEVDEEDTAAASFDEEETDDAESDNAADDEECDDEIIDEEDDEEDEDEDDEPLTVDEALRRKRSSDLHKAFSLNDRFRYRRELFANNDVEMNDTLNLVETMHSFAEAEDFFYGDLEWDKESPEVIDFMEIIKNYFYNRK